MGPGAVKCASFAAAFAAHRTCALSSTHVQVAASSSLSAHCAVTLHSTMLLILLFGNGSKKNQEWKTNRIFLGAILTFLNFAIPFSCIYRKY